MLFLLFFCVYCSNGCVVVAHKPVLDLSGGSVRICSVK